MAIKNAIRAAAGKKMLHTDFLGWESARVQRFVV
jgi:hypothetical protein